MLQDLELGRPLEIEALLGAVVEVAEWVGVPAPLASALLVLVRQRAAMRQRLTPPLLRRRGRATKAAARSASCSRFPSSTMSSSTPATALDAAAERYASLGFTLTPRGHHTLGSINNLAILGTDYIELLGVPPRRGPHRRAGLAGRAERPGVQDAGQRRAVRRAAGGGRAGPAAASLLAPRPARRRHARRCLPHRPPHPRGGRRRAHVLLPSPHPRAGLARRVAPARQRRRRHRRHDHRRRGPGGARRPVPASVRAGIGARTPRHAAA